MSRFFFPDKMYFKGPFFLKDFRGKNTDWLDIVRNQGKRSIFPLGGNYGMIYKALKYLCMGMAFLWFVACSLDDSYMAGPSFCESNACKPSTEVLQRPTFFALELQLNDSANFRMAKLYTLDCKFLAGEDSTELSTFCVDSLRYGKSDSLRHLPQINKNSYDRYRDLRIKDDGHFLENYARIPIDDDDHLRFTLVDRTDKEKDFDVDLSSFIKMYELHGDTFDFKFPDNTEFEAYTFDTTFSEKDCSVPFTRTRQDKCYGYSVYDTPYMDTVVYCIMEQGDRYEDVDPSIMFVSNLGTFKAVELSDIGDSSACKSQRFYANITKHEPTHREVIGCDRIELASVPDSLSLSNLYSDRLMTEAVFESLGDRLYRWSETQPDSYDINGYYHSWHAITRLTEQGPDGEDEFTVYTIYKN